jgi:predicted HTH domain antitoxin
MEKSKALKKTRTIRLSDSIANDIKYFAKTKNINESEYIRKIIKERLKEEKTEIAINAYKNKELTLSEAASLADISYREFRNKLIEKNIKTDFDSVGTNINYLIEKIKT